MITPEQQELVAAVRAAVAKRGGPAVDRQALDSELGYDAALWRTLCEQVGVAALAIPEEYGGFGASLAESLLVVGELGRSLAGVPMLG
ncbi:acyl-CoA dehydrogenase family protein, partial [Nocardia cyriacigeorgica]